MATSLRVSTTRCQTYRIQVRASSYNFRLAAIILAATESCNDSDGHEATAEHCVSTLTLGKEVSVAMPTDQVGRNWQKWVRSWLQDQTCMQTPLYSQLESDIIGINYATEGQPSSHKEKQHLALDSPRYNDHSRTSLDRVCICIHSFSHSSDNTREKPCC